MLAPRPAALNGLAAGTATRQPPSCGSVVVPITRWLSRGTKAIAGPKLLTFVKLQLNWPVEWKPKAAPVAVTSEARTNALDCSPALSASRLNDTPVSLASKIEAFATLLLTPPWKE